VWGESGSHVSAFSLTLKPERGGEPPRITRMVRGEHGGGAWHVPGMSEQRWRGRPGGSGDGRGAGGRAGAMSDRPHRWARGDGGRTPAWQWERGTHCGRLPGAAGPALGLLLFPPLFLLALDREGFPHVLVGSLTRTSRKRPDFGERKGLTKLETRMGKPFSVLHEHHQNKRPKAPDKPSQSVMWCPVSWSLQWGSSVLNLKYPSGKR